MWGVGGLIRDDECDVIWPCSKVLVADFGALTAQLLAEREAVELVDNLGLVVRNVENDSSNAVQAIKNSLMRISLLGY